MIIKKKPELGEKTKEDRQVVGHYQQYAVIQDEAGHLFCTEDAKEILESGEFYNGESVMPISELPVEEQQILERVFAEGGI